MKIRALISFVLVLLLVLTSQAMAVARGSADATGHMVLCVGADTVVVYTDARGEPTSDPHFCPDCALHLAFAAVGPELTAPQRITIAHRSLVIASQNIPPRRGRVPQSRAPPFVV